MQCGQGITGERASPAGRIAGQPADHEHHKVAARAVLASGRERPELRGDAVGDYETRPAQAMAFQLGFGERAGTHHGMAAVVKPGHKEIPYASCQSNIQKK